jgi:hypothetical protein
MYIVTFIQSDSNNVDSNLCSTPKEVFKLIENFFQESRLTGLEELPTVEDPEVIGDYLSIGVGCYTTIHIQKLNAYSYDQLLMIDRRIGNYLDNQETPLAPQEPLKPFVVAATLPDYSQVVLGRFDNESDQKMFEMNCSIYSYEECKCGVCGKVLGEDDEVYTDYYSPALLCDSHSRFNEETDMYEATEGDLEYRKRTVKVVLEDGDSYETPIYGTKKIVEDYFAIGSTLNMGTSEDRMVAIKELIFLS